MKILAFQTDDMSFSLISFVRVSVQLSSMFIFKIFLVFNILLKQAPKHSNIVYGNSAIYIYIVEGKLPKKKKSKRFCKIF